MGLWGGNVVYDKETVQEHCEWGENDYTYEPTNSTPFRVTPGGDYWDPGAQG